MAASVGAGAAAAALACGLSSVFGAGPVCVIGTTRSAFGASAGLRGAVTVNTPSDDNDDWMSLGLMPAGS